MVRKRFFNLFERIRRSNKSITLMVFSILGLVGLIFILLNTDFGELFVFFQNTTIYLVVFFILIQVSLMVVLTSRWAVILKSQGHRNINLFRLNKYRVAGQSISFFTPTARIGGEGVKTRIMAKRESLKYGRALSSVVLDNAVDLTASGFFFFIGALIVIASISGEFATKIFLGFLVLLFVFALGLFNYRLFKGKPLIHSFAKRVGLFKIKRIRRLELDIKKFDRDLHEFYRRDKRYFFYAIGLSFLSWVLMFLEYYVAGRMFGLNFSLWMIFLIVTLVGIAYLLPVPMALGTLEAGQLSAFIILSLNTAAGIGLSLIIRAKDLLIALWGIGIISFYGFDVNKSLEKSGFGDDEVFFDESEE